MRAYIAKWIDQPVAGKPLVDVIVDSAGQKGTGRWTLINAAENAVVVSTINAAVEARVAIGDPVGHALAARVADHGGSVPRMIKAAGGAEYGKPEDYDWMYGRSFEDPDGHTWEVFWMDPVAAEKGPAAVAQQADAAAAADHAFRHAAAGDVDHGQPAAGAEAGAQQAARAVVTLEHRHQVTGERGERKARHVVSLPDSVKCESTGQTLARQILR